MEQKEHKRRVRYKGTHPRSYQEKYKELQPEKYKDTVEKVIRKGSTPAGMHISICVKEILSSQNTARSDRSGCNAGIRRTFLSHAKMSGRPGTSLRPGCGSY